MDIRIEEDTIDLSRYGNIDVDAVEFGIYGNVRYPDGTPVSLAAIVNEYGTADGKIPERPFFRHSMNEIADQLPELLSDLLDDDLNLNANDAMRIGEKAVEVVRESITDWAVPPNAPSTVARKGFNDPLIETTRMRESVTYKLIR